MGRLRRADMSEPPVHKTRYPELGFCQQAPGLWRFIAMDTRQAVGLPYPTRTELLANLDRYARDYGCTGARPEPPVPAPLRELILDLANDAEHWSNRFWQAVCLGEPDYQRVHSKEFDRTARLVKQARKLTHVEEEPK